MAIADSCTNNGTISPFSAEQSFTTLACPEVSNVTIVGVTSTSATVTWSGTADSYSIEYGEGNFYQGQGTLVTGITQTAYEITGLEPDRNYSVYIRSECGSTVGLWSVQKTFHTSLVGIDEAATEPFAADIYPNPASGTTKLSVSGTKGSVRVQVVDLNGRTVAVHTLTDCDSGCKQTIALDGLSVGSYFVRIDSDGKRLVKKLIVK